MKCRKSSLSDVPRELGHDIVLVQHDISCHVSSLTSWVTPVMLFGVRAFDFTRLP